MVSIDIFLSGTTDLFMEYAQSFPDFIANKF